MMIHKLFWIGFLLIYQVAFAQTRATVDSVNNIPYEVKIASAATLHKSFFKNAANAKKLKYIMGEACSYSNLGLIYYYQGRYDLNIRYCLKAIRLFELAGEKEKQASEYAGLGYSMKRRNMNKALVYMRQGKAIAEAGNFQNELRAIYDNYGVLMEMRGELDSALYYYNKSLLLKEKVLDSVGIPYSLNNIAGIYSMKKKFSDAKKMYDKSLKIRIIRKDSIGMAENYTSLGDLAFARKDYPLAIINYKKSLAFAIQHEYSYLIQSNYNSLANCYEALKNPVEAYANFKRHSQYKDSLLNKETNSKIAELEIQFETNKKEKLLAENKTQLIKKEAEVRKRNILLFGTSILALLIGIIGFLIYRQQKLKNRQLQQEYELTKALSLIESQNQLHHQRLSISRDLHDNIGAQLTFIISSIDNIKYAFNITNTKLDNKLTSINNFTKDTILELRDTIWAMNNNEITFDDLRARILNFIEKAKLARENVEFIFFVDDNLTSIKLSSVQGMNIYRTIQESVNNALKYAEANMIKVNICKIDDAVEILISDNGAGFNTENTNPGNGLSNMRKRIDDINGYFSLSSSLEHGTDIKIRFIP